LAENKMILQECGLLIGGGENIENNNVLLADSEKYKNKNIKGERAH
jgi:hypothetical protein